MNMILRFKFKELNSLNKVLINNINIRGVRIFFMYFYAIYYNSMNKYIFFASLKNSIKLTIPY